MQPVNDAKPQFQKAIEHFKSELATIRTGEANPALLDNIQVESYGAMSPIKTVASISIPDPKTIQIDPWDQANVKAIESALMKSDLGINPNVSGKTIRLVMPMMTDELRQKLVKLVKTKQEDARIAIRKIREDVKKQIDSMDGGEDEQRGAQSKLDDLVKEMNAEVEEIAKKKEERITTI
ncbi:MAG: ribosome recycling factor [bacterium]|nr:ribosome recycling factor [bacterium]MDA1024527.1 ribosome recycling factor [bacterium]